MKPRMKVRDLRAYLRSIGCVVLRVRGSHEIWQTPSGHTLPPIVANHQNDDASRGVVMKVAAALKLAGFGPKEVSL